MALGISSDVKGMSSAALEAAGAGAPAGRTRHYAFGDPSELKVFDVWDSEESFAAFGETLMPILGDHGIEAGEPIVMPLYNKTEG
jgi:hypothetical protein